MKQLKSLRWGLGALVALPLLVSCSDSLSDIGESVQPGQDKVTGQITYVQFAASTVASPEVNSTSQEALLGELVDAQYGTVRGEYITQVRTAAGFKIDSLPAGGGIDSVSLRLFYQQRAGNALAPINIEVYEVAKGFTGSSVSVKDLENYRKTAQLLTSKTIVPGRDAIKLKDGTDSAFYIIIPLRNASGVYSDLGQRILDLSRSNPEYFLTQESFGKNVLGGLLVTPATGSGYLLEIAQTELILHYHHPARLKPDSIVKAQQPMVSTLLTPRLNGISATDLSALTAPSSDYTYIKGPAGVTTELTLSAADLQRLARKAPAPASGMTARDFFGRVWMLADAPLSLRVDNPAQLTLNPSAFMVLLESDSVRSFFGSATPSVRAGYSYISDRYQVQRPVYNFRNVAQLIMRHLAAHAKYTADGWTVTEPLKVQIYPVSYNTSQGVTLTLQPNLFPNFVRLSKKPETLRVGFVSSLIQQQ